MMIMDRNRRLIVIAIVFAAFNALAFIVPFERGGAFWVAWLFANATIAAVPVVYFVAFKDADSLRKVFMAMPLARIAHGCLYAQLTVCVGFMISATFLPTPAWYVAIPCVLILAYGALAVFKADWGREVIQQIDERQVANTAFMMNFRADLAAFIPRTQDAALRSRLEELAKAAKFSDPVTNPGSHEIEAEISRRFEVLKYSAANDLPDALTLATELLHTLSERNNRLKAQKRQYH